MLFNVCIGLPIPVVAISAGIAHDHYGNNERWATIGIIVVNTAHTTST